MSEEYFEKLEFIEEIDDCKDVVIKQEEEEEREFVFTKEIEELQSIINKNRLLELYTLMMEHDNKEFVIYIGETNLNYEEDSPNEFVFVYAKGLKKNWEFPLFVFYIKDKFIDGDGDYNVKGLLKLILQLLHTVKLKPLACIMDWNPSNEKMLYDFGITVYNPYIKIRERQTILCFDFFHTLKDPAVNTKMPSNIQRYMDYFNKECENLATWKEEFEKFKELLRNVYVMEIPMFILFYSVASRIAALEAAKTKNCWPIKMVCFRQTKLQTFLYRIHLERISKYDELLKILPNIYMEYY